MRDLLGGPIVLIDAEESIEAVAAYADVHLSGRGKEVALLLCVDDWNYEVVYWLLNFWSNSETMKVGDVRGGNLPFSDVSKFKEMNEWIGRLARILGEEGGAALEKKGKKKYSGKKSVKEVLSGMIKIVTKHDDIVKFMPRAMWRFIGYEGDEYCLPDSVKKADVAEPFWSFVCDSFAGYVVEVCALTCLLDVREMTAKGSNQNNLMIATSILLYLSDILLQCGAKPGRCHAIGKYKNKTALHAAAKISDKDVGIKVAQALLSKCDEQSISEFVNAADERGRTALHIASEKGYAAFCGVLVDGGALVTAQDKMGTTALHYALEKGFDEVVDVLMESPDVCKSLDLKDDRGYTPLDVAVSNILLDVPDGKKKCGSIEKLLSNSEKIKAYFNKVDPAQFLRTSLLCGLVNIVDKLFKNGIRLPAGECDEGGKTALQLAAMCDDESDALEIISLLIRDIETPDLEKMVAKRDKRGRTVLHEAALNGYAELCQGLLELNSELIYIKDRDGRNPLYDVVQGEYKDRESINPAYSLSMKLLDAYLKTDRPGDDLMDSSNRTLLHIAASQGKAEFVHELLSRSKIKEKLLSRADIRAQTALHMAVKREEKDIVKILLDHGAHPLRERDCDGRTALHYAVQAETEHKMELASILLEECKLREEEKLLLLCASASGVGTADRDLSKDDPLYKLLVDKRKGIEKDSKLEKFGGNLLKMAASLGDIEMSKELITGGYQIGDLRDSGWMSSLDNPNQNNVHKVLIHIDMIREQGNDKPAISDSLGRLDNAHGLAALFLNPYIRPPIAVGITGSWGMGKSSLMLQTERILLTTAAQMSLLQSSKLSKSELESPDLQLCESSRVGKRKCEHIYRQLESNASQPKADPAGEENVPSVLAVQYNAWRYRDDTEGLAGIAVEITKELEGIMTLPQWLSICWRNTWRQNKYALWIEIFFPFLVTLVLVCSLTWIVWVVFDNDKLKEWGKAKYAWPPAAAVITVWTITKSIMGILKPVSTQLIQYISFPDHTDKLGYQERVISDISFLKEQIGKKAHRVFIVFCWVLTTFTVLWGLISELCITSFLFRHRSHERVIEAPNVALVSGRNLRIIVFVDDLDRCEESVILKELATECRKHPREWKRLLNYHRLVWYIFSVNEDAKNSYGWQVELITWIFICWEWQEFMNLVIKKWKEIGDLKMNAPSLLKIVKHLIEEREKENRKTTSCEEDNSKSTVDFLNSENGSAEKLSNGMEQKLDALEKSLAELKKEMKQLKDVICDELKKDIKELKEQVSDELKNHIRETKEQMVGMESGNSEESWEIEKKNWERMKSTFVDERY
ncbi:hypothetical protein SUGI_0409440 [Cryptomeria japonica]|nr:hypothetical protein SUGI_0409440 [Cryptomeria japonica]